MGFRTTGVRLTANVTQYIRELRQGADATRKFGDQLDSARLRGARMANDITGAAKASAAELKDMRDNVKSLDDQVRKSQTNVADLAKTYAKTGDKNVFKQLEQQQKDLKNLTNVRNLLPDPRLLEQTGEEMAKSTVKGFRGGWQERVGVAAAPAIVALGPQLGAVIGGAIVGAAGLGGVVGGLVLAARDERVKSAGIHLGQSVMEELDKRSTGFVVPTLNAIERIRLGFEGLGPDLERIFTASRFVEPLTEAGLKGGAALTKGIGDAVEHGEPMMAALNNLVSQTGVVFGRLFSTLAGDAEVNATAFNDFTMALSNFVDMTGGLLHVLSNIVAVNNEVDRFVDKARYWIEDNNALKDGLKALGYQVDLTADGFKVGSKEAEAYRKATQGTATALDFATLSLAGMEDAQIASIDASGTYRAEMAEVKASTDEVAASEASRKEIQKAVTLANKELTAANKAYKQSLDELGPSQGRARDLAEGLRTAGKNLYGAQIAGVEANELYEKSWDDLSKAVKDNGTSLDIHTKKGRASRDGLEALLQASVDMYYADIDMGVATDKARASHEKRTKAVEKEADRLHLNDRRTKDLIKTYNNIPPDKTTKLILAGLTAIRKALENVYLAQRALAEGKTIQQMKDADSNRAWASMKGWASGGWTGPGHTHQAAGLVHADEYVINKGSRRQIERQNPGLLDEMNATGRLPGYAEGGPVAPVDTSRQWPFKVDISDTFVMSMKDALAKVMPNFGDWPSSPSAQRGDSGVWRRIVALINSTGPMSGHFGNAYRPGDPLWHGSGRAVDWMGFNQDGLARFLAARRPLELIHRTKQRDYAYTRGVNKGSFNESLMEAHRNHVHVAMSGGGIIGEPVLGFGRSGATYSFAERGPERVLSHGQSVSSGHSIAVTLAPTITISGSELSPQQIATAVNRELGTQFARLMREMA